MTEKPNLGAGSIPIDLRGLPEGETPFRAAAAGGRIEWGEDPPRIFREGTVEGTLTRDASEVRIRGNLRGALESVCDRCLTRFDLPIDTPMELRVVFDDSRAEGLAPDEGIFGAEDEDGVRMITVAPDSRLDIANEVREAVVLEAPIKSLCREDCRGLCPVCGVNRNLEDCACDPTPRDSRWAALREISFPSDVQE